MFLWHTLSQCQFIHEMANFTQPKFHDFHSFWNCPSQFCSHYAIRSQRTPPCDLHISPQFATSGLFLLNEEEREEEEQGKRDFCEVNWMSMELSIYRLQWHNWPFDLSYNKDDRIQWQSKKPIAFQWHFYKFPMVSLCPICPVCMFAECHLHINSRNFTQP